MGEGSDDASDVARVLAGDAEAFAGIVRRWQRRLVNLAWRFCRDRGAAEDMAQEAFVRAFRSHIPTRINGVERDPSTAVGCLQSSQEGLS